MKCVEQVLEKYAIDYKVETIAITDIAKEPAKQIRFQVLDQSLVGTYAEAMKRGDKFPPIVVRRNDKRKKLELIDGNHRRAATLAAGEEKTAAYIIAAPDDVVAALVSEFNITHGANLSQEEKLAHGSYLVDNLGMTLLDSAERVGLTVSQLETHRMRRRAIVRLEAADVAKSTINALNVNVRQIVSAAPGEGVIKAFAALAADAKMSDEQAAQTAKEIKHLTTERARQTYLQECRDGDLREQIQRGRLHSHSGRNLDTDAAKLSRGIGLVLKVDPKRVVTSSSAKQALAGKALEASQRLIEIAKELS